MRVVFTVRGVGGELLVFEDKLTITPKGILGILNKGLKGTKTIPFRSITAIQHKEAGIINGYLQFTLSGGVESRAGAFAAVSDENTFMYGTALNAKMREIKNYIERRCDEIRSPTPQTPLMPSLSAPTGIRDQLAKLADLRERGLITEEEFAPIRSPRPKLRQCPFCAEDIRVEAIKCKHCGSMVEPAVPAPAPPAPTNRIETILQGSHETYRPTAVPTLPDRSVEPAMPTPAPPGPTSRIETTLQGGHETHEAMTVRTPPRRSKEFATPQRRVGPLGVLGLVFLAIMLFVVIVTILGPTQTGSPSAVTAADRQSPTASNQPKTNEGKRPSTPVNARRQELPATPPAKKFDEEAFFKMDLSSPEKETSKKEKQPWKMTMAKYEALQNGMTYAQVVSIIGKEGEELSRSDIAGLTTVIYQWQNKSFLNLGGANAIFQNGKLVQKAQFNLK